MVTLVFEKVLSKSLIGRIINEKRRAITKDIQSLS